MNAHAFTALITLAACSPLLARDMPPEISAGELAPPPPVSVFGGIDIASAYIFGDGTVVNDAPVIQPGAGIAWTPVDGLSLGFDVWANYATDHHGDMTRDHGFNEVDLTLGLGYESDSGLALGVGIASWQYPNTTWTDEEMLLLSVARTIGPVTIGADVEYTLTGDYEEDCDFVPAIALEQALDENVTAGVKAKMTYTLGGGASRSGWTACVLTAQIEAFDITAYASYYGQLADKIYTDDIHDEASTVFGIGYAVEY